MFSCCLLGYNVPIFVNVEENNCIEYTYPHKHKLLFWYSYARMGKFYLFSLVGFYKIYVTYWNKFSSVLVFYIYFILISCVIFYICDNLLYCPDSSEANLKNMHIIALLFLKLLLFLTNIALLQLYIPRNCHIFVPYFSVVNC